MRPGSVGTRALLVAPGVMLLKFIKNSKTEPNAALALACVTPAVSDGALRKKPSHPAMP